ncbi:MAG: cysteine desulfurase [Bacilli bacterium]|nr:cysteine desulfurase [Bacilli bacterium]
MNREDFPMLDNDMIYFDNGATTLKPKCVVNKMVDYYTNYTSNIHRGDYDAAIKTNREYDEVREIVRDFINASSDKEIVFTKGSTEALNMICFGYYKHFLKPGDEVLISKAEHASSVIPWFVLEKEIGIKVKCIPLDSKYEITLDNVKNSITDATKVISLSHISNVVGDIRDTYGIGSLCKEKNIDFVVDASQAVGHVLVDVLRDNISFLAFSAHKMLGPTGVGVLYGKYDLLLKMQPIYYGGGMNQFFEEDGTYELKMPPLRFEAGTPPIAEVIGMGEAIKYINNIGIDNIRLHEMTLKKYLVNELEKIDNVILYNKTSESGIIVFNLDGVFSQDTSIYLNHYHIYIRAGNHCTKMLKDDFNIKNTCRVSLHLYNTKNEVDKLIEVLKNSKDIFKVVI